MSTSKPISGTLYTYADNFRSYKALIAAKYSGASLSQELCVPKVTNEEWFQKKFPLGKLPAFESNDDYLLTESNAIAYYVGNDMLRGISDQEKAKVLQWQMFADQEVLPAVAGWVFPVLGITQYNKQVSEQAKERMKNILCILNEELKLKTYLVGERVTLADICLACNLLLAYQNVLDGGFRQPFTNVNRWYSTLMNKEEFKSVIGDVKLCEKMGQFDQKKYQQIHGGGAGKKDTKKKGKEGEKPAASPAKKEENVTEKEEPDASEEALAQEPKAKNPFAALPKTAFNMDEFKRVYSNEDTETVAIPYFWKNFDKETQSIWYCEYKYPDELNQVFMSCNLIAGMFQRLDKLRKNAFGSMILFGENNDSEIRGIWFWQGDKLAFELSPDWQIDYESYTWKKLDPDDASTVNMVNEYFTWEGEFHKGKKFNQGKIFK